MAAQGAPAVGAVGIGLRAPHYEQVLELRPELGFLEVHSENFFCDGGAPLAWLERFRAAYALSLHGVGLSLGTAEGIDIAHLRRLAALVERTEPMLVSEHLSWSVTSGIYLNDLLPLPYTEETLAIVADNVAKVQDTLRRRLLVENPSSYLRFRHSTIPEPEFLAALVARTGCGLLCDVNNIHVTCANLGGDAAEYLDALPATAIGEIHLAGHAEIVRGGKTLLIDDHGAPVAPAVWQLYRRALQRCGVVPSLVEWDKALPPLAILLQETRTATAVARAMKDADARAA
jgi:uncharacterized protein (UPF0276 family)